MEPFVVEAIDQSPVSDLGEGPHWDKSVSSLYYVDAFVGDVHRYETKEGKHSRINLGDLVTIVIPIEGQPDHVIVSLRNKIVDLNWSNKTHTVLAEVSPDLNGKERFNDGKIDPFGRLWIGTVLHDDSGAIVPYGGSLYKLSNNKFEKMSSNFTISNGMAWNHNRTQMYFNDSEDRKTYVFDFNLTDGTILNKRVLLDYSQFSNLYGREEYPDGMAIDVDDNIWIALYGGARVIHIDPRQNGKLLHSVPVPAPQTTSLAFGGKDFSKLYVTTGNGNVKDNHELKLKYPHAGKIFKISQQEGMSGPKLLKGLDVFNAKIMN
ncbi:hypothetical protein BLOT_008293 [Blomia tropicalis]|nr:hypothetical protein BLOT_008293 [Blomia tropicalis]